MSGPTLRANKLASTVVNTCEDLVEACCNAWNFFANDPTTITSTIMGRGQSIGPLVLWPMHSLNSAGLPPDRSRIPAIISSNPRGVENEECAAEEM